jgi:rod shape-determining protein MreD
MAVVRSWSFALFMGLVVLAHFVVRLAIGVGPDAPDLLTVAALLGARRVSGAQAAALGLLLGVLDDALTVVSFGSAAVALTIVCFLGSRSRDMFEGDSLLFLFIYVFLGKWLRDALVFLLSSTTRGADTAAELFIAMPLAALLAAGAGLLVMILYRASTDERS